MILSIFHDVLRPTYPPARLRSLFRRDEGASVVEIALIMPILLVMLVGAVDFGQAYYSAIEVASAAQAGALYGTQQPSDVTGMQAAARLDAPDVTNLVATAIYGCQCSDGTSPSAQCASPPVGCSTNIVNYVQVTTTATYTALLRFPGVPITIPLSSVVRMRAAH